MSGSRLAPLCARSAATGTPDDTGGARSTDVVSSIAQVIDAAQQSMNSLANVAEGVGQNLNVSV